MLSYNRLHAPPHINDMDKKHLTGVQRVDPVQQGFSIVAVRELFHKWRPLLYVNIGD